MDLSRSLVKKFSKSVTQPDNSNVETYIRGTIKVIGDKKFVQLDGSEQMTPISEVTDAQNGDRVLVTIEKHAATVIGNYTYPPSARTANEALEKAEDSQDAAEKASESAKAATTAASEAKRFATESQAIAQEAKNLASEAITSASGSRQLAEQAIVSATKANEDITAIHSDILTVTNDIKNARTDLSEQIDSNVEYFVANYATKTEVSTVEGNLNAEISKSAAELRTTMSENYVGKTDLVEIQANLQSQISQNAEGISLSASKIQTLETNTAGIQNDVLAAQTAANNAKTAADKAQADATAAKTAANNAQKTADEADASLQIANTNLDEAKANLESVTSRVDATEEEIDAAQQAVNEAQSAVNKAQADATAAQTAANNAKTAADKAQADATAAQSAADKAQADVDAVTSRVTIAETNISNNAEAITLTANKVESLQIGGRNLIPSSVLRLTTAGSTKSFVARTWGSALIYANDLINILEPSTEYTIHYDAEIIERTPTPTATTMVIGFMLYSPSTSGVSKTLYAEGIVGVGEVGDTAQASITFTTPDVIPSDYRLNIYTRLWTTNGTAPYGYDTIRFTNLKLEKGNKATDWTPAPEDIDATFDLYSTTVEMNSAIEQKADSIKSEVSATYTTKTEHSAVKTTAEQTANKITWLVESGTSATDFTLTDRVAELTAQHINLNGLVTFSGLDSSVQNRVSTIEGWAHTSDTTLIDGSKIYTGTITADKLSVTSLSAICATIGGFTIGPTSLYSGVDALMKANGVYLGINGISCGDKFRVTASGNATFRWYDELNEDWLRIYIGEDAAPLEIRLEDSRDNDWTIFTYNGMYRASGKSLYFLNDFEFYQAKSVGTFDKPAGHYYMDNAYHVYSKTADESDKVNLIYLSENDKIHIGADNMPGNTVVFHNNIAFDSRGSVGTETAPSGNHYMANNRYVCGLNKGGNACKLIGITSGNNITVGTSDGSCNGIYLNAGYHQPIYLNSANADNSDTVTHFRIIYHSDLAKMVIYAPAINDNTTSSNSANLVIGSTGILYKYVSSSRRYKEAISETLSDGLNPNRLYDLPVVEYIYKKDYLPETDIRYRQKFIGFIAEDVENIYPLATNYDEDGRVESWNVNVMLPAMLKLIQDQHKVDSELSNRINSSNIQIEHLRYQLEQAMLRIAEQQKEIDNLKMAG